ncbi:Stf0 family sulfotransferase [Altererythrobacter sp. MTPC7]|uniref:Stf0 family sulfotransferase n=1 Tax=Altererythrobacter sp. MTPC7 TaxID=3056567 RepID=UPI0036F31390
MMARLPKADEIVSHSGQYDEEWNFPASTHRRTLLIASTGRCGSHMLGRAMHATGRFGFPLEYCHPANLRIWGKKFGETEPVAILRKIIEHRTSPNGVFGLKMHFSHLRAFPNRKQLFEALGDVRVVHLLREDLAGQAVSNAIATQTGVWLSGMMGTGREPQYDEALILRSMRQIAADNAGWREFLGRAAIPSVLMTFSRVSADLPSAIREIAEFADIDISGVDIRSSPATRKQGTSRNAEWVKRFKSANYDHMGSAYASISAIPRMLAKLLLGRV